MVSEDNVCLSPEDAALLLELLDKCHYMRHALQAVVLVDRLKACALLVPPVLDGTKVWTGSSNGRNNCIVRARTGAEAVRLLNAAGFMVGSGRFRSHWMVTGNRKQLCAATERGVWEFDGYSYVRRGVVK